MKLRQPSRTEARVWLGKFNEAYQSWLAGHCADPSRLQQAFEAIRCLLEREPEGAETVVGIVFSVLFNGAAAMSGHETLPWIDLYFEAERLTANADPGRPIRSAWLENRRAAACLDASRWFDAQQACNRALAHVPSGADQPLAPWVRAAALRTLGQAAEAVLDWARARDAYEEACRIIEPLAQQKTLKTLTVGLAKLLYGAQQIPSPVIEALIQRTWQDTAECLVGSAIGLARVDASAGLPGAVQTAARAFNLIDRVGPGSADALDLGPIFRAANPDSLEKWLDTILAKARDLNLNAPEFQRVLLAFAAAGYAEKGLDPAPLIERSRSRDWQPSSPLAAAVVSGLELTHSGDPPGNFIEDLHALEFAAEPRLENWRIRMLFDAPLAAAGRTITDTTRPRNSPPETATPSTRGKKSKSRPGRRAVEAKVDAMVGSAGLTPEARSKLSLVLDALHPSKSKFERWRPASNEAGASAGATNDRGKSAEAIAGDRLGRIEHALKQWPEAVALILRKFGPETTFLCLSGGEPTIIARASSSWDTAADALRQKVSDEIAALEVTRVACPPESIQRAGEAALACWPQKILDRVKACDVLLICPDHRSGGATIPYELLHDGKDWLGIAKIVARFPSVRALTRSVEGSVRRDSHRRALSLAVPEADGFAPLPCAMDEAAQVQARLASAGWDAPATDPARVTPEFVLDRLPYLTHLHISAHGESDRMGDSLILADGQRLNPADLLSRFFARMPTVFLNTCSLGSSRYLGGGLSHGIAHTVLESGAPAVVANLVPVDDQVSSRMARTFYDQSDAGFGEALRASRREAVAMGVSPLLWGSTVLLGDPRTTLSPRRTDFVLSEQLLDAYFPGGSEADREPVRRQVERQLRRDPLDIRLQSAVELIRDVASWNAAPGPELRNAILHAFRAAWELDHLPTAAILGVLVTQTFDDQREANTAFQVIEQVLELVEPLENESATWKSILDQLLVRWLQLRRGERRFEVQGHGPVDENALDVGKAVLDIQLAIEARAIRRGDAPRATTEERTDGEVIWNAILASRTLRFDDMPESFAFASGLVEKLAQMEVLDDVTIDRAKTAVAGLLGWLWESQHVADLPPEMAKGQAGVLACLIKSLGEWWRPGHDNWLEAARTFPDEIQSQLRELDAMPYDEKLYVRMDEIFEGIFVRAEKLIGETRVHYPERIPDLAAWILGCLIRTNTYSYTDGSVPESICDRFKQVHGRLSGKAEGWFMPWLMDGFRPVREAVPDDLDRWRYGLSTGR